MPLPINPLYMPNTRRVIRFSDESGDFYDPATKDFHDLSGFSSPANGRLGDYKFVAGAAPVFENVGPNNNRALRVDGGAYWQYLPSNPYEGSNYLIFRPVGLTATAKWPYLWGADANALLAGGVQITSTIMRAISPFANTNAPIRATAFTNGAVYIAVWAASQRLRKLGGSGGSPDTTVTYNAVAEDGSNSGKATYWQATSVVRDVMRGMFGSLDNTQPVLTASGVTYLDVFEAGEWGSDDPWGDYPTELMAWYTAKKAEYGAV